MSLLRHAALILALTLMTAPAPVIAQETDAPAEEPATETEALPTPTAITFRALDGQTLLRTAFADEEIIAQQIIRMIGIAVPSIMDGGMPARLRLDELLDGVEVSCDVRARAQDNTLFARCIVGEDTDLAAALLADGLAVVDRRQEIGQTLSAEYETAEAQAREAGLGMWEGFGDSEPVEEPVVEEAVEPAFTLVDIAVIGLLVLVLLVLIWSTLSISGEMKKTRQTIRSAG